MSTLTPRYPFHQIPSSKFNFYKRGHSYTVVENVNWYRHYGKYISMHVPQKSKTRMWSLSCDPAILLNIDFYSWIWSSDIWRKQSEEKDHYKLIE